MALIPCPECQKQVSSLAATCPSCGVAIAGGAAAGPFPAAAAAPGPEQTVWEGTPSTALLIGKLLRTLFAVVLLPLVASFAFPHVFGTPLRVPAAVRPPTGSAAEFVGYVVVLILAVFALVSLAGLLTAIARIKSQHYRVTTQRLLVERGLLSKSVEEIDMRYVDETLFTQRLVERLLGIGEVVVVSSDKVAPRFVLLGVRDPRKVRELIRSTAYQASQRQYFTRAT